MTIPAEVVQQIVLHWIATQLPPTAVPEFDLLDGALDLLLP